MLTQSVACLDVSDESSLKKALKQLSQIVKVRIKRMTQAEVDMYTGKDRDNTYAGNPHISGESRRNTFYNDSGFESYSRSNYDSRGLHGHVDGFFKKRKPSSYLDSQLACKRTKQDFKDYQRDSGGRFNDSYCQETSYNGDRYSQVPLGRSYNKYCNENRNACKVGVRGRYKWPRGSRKVRETYRNSEPLRSDAKVYSKESKEVTKDKMLQSDVIVSHNDEENRKQKYNDRSKDWSRTIQFSGSAVGGLESTSSTNKSPSVKTDIDGKPVLNTTNKFDSKLKNSGLNDSAACSQIISRRPCAPPELAQKDGPTVTESNSIPQKFLKQTSSLGNDEDTSKDNSGNADVPQSDQNIVSISNADLDKLATEVQFGKSQGCVLEGPKPITGREEVTCEFYKTDSVKTTDAKLNFGLSEKAESPKHEVSESVKQTEIVPPTDNTESSEDIQNLTRSNPVAMEIVDTRFEENMPSYSLHIVEEDEHVEEENCDKRNHLEEVVNFVAGICGNLEITSSQGKCPVVDSVCSGMANNCLEGAQQNCPPTKDSQSGEKEPVTLKVKAETVVSETANLVQNCNEAPSKDPPSEVSTEKLPQNTVNVELVTSSKKFRRSKVRKNDNAQNGSVLQTHPVKGNVNLRKASNARNPNVGLVKKSVTRKVNKISNLKEKSSCKVPENNLLVVPEKKKKYTILFEELFGKDDDDVVEIFSKVGAAQVGQCGKKEKEPSAGSKTLVMRKLKTSTDLEEGKIKSSSHSPNRIVPKENSSKKICDRSTSQDVPPSAAFQEGELPWVLKEIELEVIKDPRLSTSKRRKSSDLKIEKIAKRLKRNVSVPNSIAEKVTVSSENEAVNHPEREVTDHKPPKASRSLSDSGKISDCDLIVEKVLQSKIEIEKIDYEEGNLVIDLDEGCNKVKEEKLNTEDININHERSVPNSEGNQTKLLSPKNNVNVIAKISSHSEGNTTSGNLPEWGNHSKKLDVIKEETILEVGNLVESDVCKKKQQPDFEPPVQTEEEANITSESLASQSTIISEESLKPKGNTNNVPSHVNKCNETASSGGSKIHGSCQDGESLVSDVEIGSVEQSAPKFSNAPILVDSTRSKDLDCVLAPADTNCSAITGCNVALQESGPGKGVSIDVNKGGTLNKHQPYIRVKDPKTLGIRSSAPEDNQLHYFNQIKEKMLQQFQAAPPHIVLKVRDFCQLTISVRNDLYQYLIHKNQIMNSSMPDPDKASDLNCAYHCLYYCCELKAGNMNKILQILHGYFQSHIQTAILYALEMEGCKTSDAKQVLHFVKKITKFRCCHISKENCGTLAEGHPHVILRSIPRQNSYLNCVVLAQLKSKSCQAGGTSNTMFSYPGYIVAHKQSSQPVQGSYNAPLSGHSTVPQGSGVPFSQPDPHFPRTTTVNQYYGQNSTLQQSDQLSYSGHLNANNPVVRSENHFPEQPYSHGAIFANPTQSDALNAPQSGTNYLERIKQPLQHPGTLPANPVQTSVPAAPPPNISGTQQNKPVNHLQQLSSVVTRAADTQQRIRASWLPHMAPSTDTCRNRPPPPYSYSNSNLANSAKVPYSIAQLSTSDTSSGEPGAATPRRYSSDSNAQRSMNLCNSSEYDRWNTHFVSQSQHGVNSVGGSTQEHNYSQLLQHRPTILRHDSQNSSSRNIFTAAQISQTNPLLRSLIEGNQHAARNFNQNRGIPQGQVQQNQFSNHQEHWQRTPQTNIHLPVQHTAMAHSSVIHQVRDLLQSSNPDGKQPNCQNKPLEHRVAAHSQFTPSNKEKLCSPTQSAVHVPFHYHQVRESHQPLTAEGKQPNCQNEALGHAAAVHSQFTSSSKEKLCSPTQSSLHVHLPYHQVRESHQPRTAEGKQPNCPNEALGHLAAVHTQFTPSNKEKLCRPIQPIIPVPVISYQLQTCNSAGVQKGPQLMRSISAQHNLHSYAVKDGQPISIPQLQPNHLTTSVGELGQGVPELSPTYMKPQSWMERGSGVTLRGAAEHVESYTTHQKSECSGQQQQTLSHEAQQQSIHQAQFDKNISQNHPTTVNHSNIRPTADCAQQQLEKSSTENRSDAAPQWATQQKSDTHSYILPKPTALSGRHNQHIPMTPQDQGDLTARSAPVVSSLSNKRQARSISLPVSLTTVAKQLGLKSPKGNSPAEHLVTQTCQTTTYARVAERRATLPDRADLRISEYWSSFLLNEVTESSSLPTEQSSPKSHSSQAVAQVNYKNAEVAQPTVSGESPAQVGIHSTAQINFRQANIMQPSMVQLQVVPPQGSTVPVTVPGNLINHANSLHVTPQLPNLTGQVSTNITSNVPRNNSHPSVTTTDFSENVVIGENAPPPITVDQVSTTTCEPHISDSRRTPETVAIVGKKVDDVVPALEKQVDTTTEVHSSSLIVKSRAVDEMPLLECQEDPLQIASIEEVRPTVLQKQIDTITSCPQIIKQGLSKGDHSHISHEDERGTKLHKIQAKSNTMFQEKDGARADVPMDTDSVPKESSCASVGVLSESNSRPAEKLHPNVQSLPYVNFASMEETNPKSDYTLSDSYSQLPCRNYCVVTTSHKNSAIEQPNKPALNVDSSEIVTSSLEDDLSVSREEMLESHPVADLGKQTLPLAATQSLDAVDVSSAMNQEQRVSSTQLPVTTPVDNDPMSGCPKKLQEPRRSVSSIAELKELIDSGEIVSISQLKSLLYFTNQSSESGPALPEKVNLEDGLSSAKRDTVLKGPINLKNVIVDQSEKDSYTENLAAEKVLSSDKPSPAHSQDSLSNLQSNPHQAENHPSGAEESEPPSIKDSKSKTLPAQGEDSFSNLQLDLHQSENIPRNAEKSPVPDKLNKSHLIEGTSPNAETQSITPLQEDSTKLHEGKPDNSYLDNGSPSSVSDGDSNCSWTEEPSPLEGSTKLHKGEPDCELDDKSNLVKRKKSSFHPEEMVEVHSNRSLGSWVSESDLVDLTCQTVEDLEEFEAATRRPRCKVRLLNDEEIDNIVNGLESNDASKLSVSTPASPDAEVLTDRFTDTLKKIGDENTEMKRCSENSVLNCESDSEVRKESSESEDSCPALVSPSNPVTLLGNSCLQEILITEEIDIKSEGPYLDIEDRVTFDVKPRNCVCCHGSSDEDDEVTVLDQIIGEYDPDIQIVGIFPKEVEVLQVIKREVVATPMDSEDLSGIKKELAVPMDSEDLSDIKKELAVPMDSEDLSGIKREAAAPVDFKDSSGIKKEGAGLVDCELVSDTTYVTGKEMPRSPLESSTKSEIEEDSHGSCKSEGHETDSSLSGYASDEEPAADCCESTETFCAPLLFPGNDEDELGKRSYAVYPENVKCAACPNVAVLLCSGCRITCYCSLNCQRKDWVECHSKECEGGQPEGGRSRERRGED